MTTNATDAAAKLAEENGIDLVDVTGTGADGRITKGDVESHLAALEETAVFDDKADTAVDELPGDMDTAVAVVEPASEPETAVSPPVLVVMAEPSETADEEPPLFANRIETAATLQELIALGDQAVSEADRAAIRARAKELLTA